MLIDSIIMHSNLFTLVIKNYYYFIIIIIIIIIIWVQSIRDTKGEKKNKN